MNSMQCVQLRFFLGVLVELLVVEMLFVGVIFCDGSIIVDVFCVMRDGWFEMVSGLVSGQSSVGKSNFFWGIM